MHKEVLNNLEGMHRALLGRNRSIQTEGSFEIMKYNRWYKGTEFGKTGTFSGIHWA